MQQQSSPETVSILHKLDLGQHTLIIMSDSSIDMLANDEHTRYPRTIPCGVRMCSSQLK